VNPVHEGLNQLAVFAEHGVPLPEDGSWEHAAYWNNQIADRKQAVAVTGVCEHLVKMISGHFPKLGIIGGVTCCVCGKRLKKGDLQPSEYAYEFAE
jgi:hypothetical protein